MLVKPSDCGDFALQTDSPLLMDYSLDYQTNSSIWAKSYTQAAYSGLRGIHTAFPFDSVPTNGFEVPCPWTNGTTCLGYNMTSGPAWRIETPPLDSHLHLGMNAPPEERITLTKNLTCAVVDPTNLSTPPYSRLEDHQGHSVNMTYVTLLAALLPESERVPESRYFNFEIDVNLVFGAVGYYTQ